MSENQAVSCEAEEVDTRGRHGNTLPPRVGAERPVNHPASALHTGGVHSPSFIAS